MKTNSVPAIIMLVAGLIDSILSIYYRLPFLRFMEQLLIVLIIFYVIGIIVKIVLDRNFKDMDDEEKNEEDEPEDAAQTEQDAEGEEVAPGQEGDVSEKEMENIDSDKNDSE